MKTTEEMVQEDVAEVLYCTYHPKRETVLRCNRCNNPICYDCAIRTPVGYRCRDCVRNHQAIYYNAQTHDLPVALIVGLLVSLIVGALAITLLSMIGWFRLLAAIFAGPAIGGFIAEVIRRSVQRRRARNLKWVAAAGVAIGLLLGGALVFLVPVMLSAGFSPSLLGAMLPRLIVRFDMLLLAVLAASTVYARLQ